MVSCPACGQDNAEGARFCNGCAAPLARTESAEVRKTVSVIFCDLVGSTALGERTDPEVLRGLMGRYHAALRGVIERHGGTVEKFIGDAAMAVFGIPRVHEDDAVRAVRAAVAMRAAVAPLGLHVRIGVNTGEVVTGIGETLVTGDAVNVAARLEQSAGTDEVLIGAGTQRLVAEVITTEPVDALTVKGKTDPVPAYRVLEGAPAPVARATAPFVGRAPELERLEDMLALVADKRVPQLATVVGAPGIGKSRLVAEFLSRVDARVLVGRCLSYGDAITYWPLVEILNELGDVGSLLATDEDADLVTVRLAAAAGTAGAAASPEEIAWAVRRLLEGLAREQPVVVVLDDIHWAEPALLDLVEYVTTFAQDAPVMMLCTARPDLFETRPDWATPRPNATVLKLEPLSPSHADWLVGALGELPAETRLRIVDASDGNPLFVEQLVAMQAESGGELEVPPSLQALLAARIDRLEAEERLVIERASVEGRLFHRGAVTELLPEQHRGEVANRLLALVRRELVRPDRAVLRGDDGFRFGHILIRDAAYESMPKRVRADLHERYADWLVERMGDGAPAEIVGYHLEQAFRYGEEVGAPKSELGRRATDALERAGSLALGRRDLAAAVKLYGRAASVAPDARRPLLMVRQAYALHGTGDLELARRVLEDAGRVADSVGDATAGRLARIELAELDFSLRPDGAAQRAFAAAEDVIETAAGGDHEVLARAWALTGHGHLMRGRMGEQMEATQRAIEQARAAGDRQLEIELAVSPGPAIAFGPVPVDEGMRMIEEMETRFGDVPSVQDFATHLRAHLRARRGEFDGNGESLGRWRSHMRELGDELIFAMTAQCVWDVETIAGNHEAAEAALREADEFYAVTGATGLRALNFELLAESRYAQQDALETGQLLDRCDEIVAADDFDTMARSRALRARLLADAGDLDAAVALAREAVGIIDRTQFTDARAAMRLHLAIVLRAAGAPAADDEIRAAIALFEEKGNEVGAKRAVALLSVVEDGGRG